MIETELINKALQGDEDSLTELYNLTFSRIYSKVLYMVGNPDDADTIVQDTYEAGFNNLSQIKVPSQFEKWIQLLADCEVVDYLDAAGNKHILSSDESVYAGTSENDAHSFIPVSDNDYTKLREQTISAFQSLSVFERLSLVMYYVDEISVSDIAEMMETNEDSVNAALSHAVVDLSKCTDDLGKTRSSIDGTRDFDIIGFAIWDCENSDYSERSDSAFIYIDMNIEDQFDEDDRKLEEKNIKKKKTMVILLAVIASMLLIGMGLLVYYIVKPSSLPIYESAVIEYYPNINERGEATLSVDEDSLNALASTEKVSVVIDGKSFVNDEGVEMTLVKLSDLVTFVIDCDDNGTLSNGDRYTVKAVLTDAATAAGITLNDIHNKANIHFDDTESVVAEGLKDETEVNMADGLELEYDIPYNGYGQAVVKADQDKLNSLVDEEELDKYLEHIVDTSMTSKEPDEYTLSNILNFNIVGTNENLSNDDTVTVRADISELFIKFGATISDIQKYTGMNFNEEFQVTVSGLDDPVVLDPMSFITIGYDVLYDGYASATLTCDYDVFNSSIDQKALNEYAVDIAKESDMKIDTELKLSDILAFTIDGDNDGLSNGDTVTLVPSCNEDYDKYGINITSLMKYLGLVIEEKYDTTVSGLQSTTTNNPFQYYNITFNGLNGEGILNIEKTVEGLGDNIVLVADKTDKLTNDDEITVNVGITDEAKTEWNETHKDDKTTTADWDDDTDTVETVETTAPSDDTGEENTESIADVDPNKYCLEKYGYAIGETSRKYTVSTLGTYVDENTEIQDASLQKMKSAAEKLFKTKNSLPSDSLKITAQNYLGYVISSSKTDGVTPHNKVFLIYDFELQSDDVTSSTIQGSGRTDPVETGKSIWVYWYVEFDDVIVSPDGSFEIDYDKAKTTEQTYNFTTESGGSWTLKGYYSYNNLYSKLIGPLAGNYSVNNDSEYSSHRWNDGRSVADLDYYKSQN